MSQGAWGVQLRQDVVECSSNNQRGQNRTGRETLKRWQLRTNEYQRMPRKSTNRNPSRSNLATHPMCWVAVDSRKVHNRSCGIRDRSCSCPLYSHCPYPALQTSSLFPHKSLVLCFNLKRPRCHTARNSSKEGFARVRKTQMVISMVMESMKQAKYLYLVDVYNPS